MAKFWLNSNKKTAGWIFLAVFLFGLDRFLKFLSMANFSHEIVGEWLRFGFAANYGIAFSLPLGGSLLNVLIFAIISGLAVWSVKAYLQEKMAILGALLMVIAGASSNLWDRLAFGYVIDYLDMRYFTVFNLADVAIVIGVGILVFIGVDRN